MKTFAKILVAGAVLFSGEAVLAKAKVLAEGQVVLKKDAKLAAKAKGIRTLYLVVYDENSRRPMPFGAKKVQLAEDASGSFHKFKLTTANVARMNPHASVPKSLKLKARLDRDGSAGMDQPGDVIGMVKGISAGSKDVKIVLDQVK